MGGRSGPLALSRDCRNGDQLRLDSEMIVPEQLHQIIRQQGLLHKTRT